MINFVVSSEFTDIFAPFSILLNSRVSPDSANTTCLNVDAPASRLKNSLCWDIFSFKIWKLSS